MLREMTQNVGRFKAGNKHDYPKGVWDKIGRDLLAGTGVKEASDEAVQKFLGEISKPIEFNPAVQSTTRGQIKVRQRLGVPTRASLRSAS